VQHHTQLPGKIESPGGATSHKTRDLLLPPCASLDPDPDPRRMVHGVEGLGGWGPGGWGLGLGLGLGGAGVWCAWAMQARDPETYRYMPVASFIGRSQPRSAGAGRSVLVPTCTQVCLSYI
jgi:hypothetical protein